MKMIRYLKNLWGNEKFRGSLLHFGVFATALSLFGYLTAADIITRKPEYVLPAPYQVLIQQSKVTSAVALEQALRSKDKDLQGLVFFNETKYVIVLKDGLENERLVVQADTDEMRKLAEAGSVPVHDLNAELEEDFRSRLPLWWGWVLAAFLIWFCWFLFKKREGGSTASRFSVVARAVAAMFQQLIAASRMKKSRLAIAFAVLLVAGLGAGSYFRLFHDGSLKTAPAYVNTAKKIEPWQVLRHLKHHAEDFQRVTLVGELKTAYLVLRTTRDKAEELRDARVSSDEMQRDKQEKHISVDRSLTFADRDSFNTFLGELQLHGIEVKNVAAEENTAFFQTMTRAGVAAFLTLFMLSCLHAAVMALYWQSWREEENPELRKTLVTAGSGGKGGKLSGVAIAPEDRKTFADVAGCQEAIDELQIVKRKIQLPRLYRVHGAPVPSGVILHGPPGTGKTLLARALAGEVGGYFHALAGSDFVEMYVGVGAQRVREAYAKARAEARKSGRISIIFIDEIDAIGKKRSAGGDSGNSEYEQTLNALLVEMNGFGNHGLVLTMAATNRLDMLDEALLRPGRFDVQVMVPKPDKKGRAQIYRIYLKKLNLVLDGKDDDERELAKDSLIDTLARRSHDFSGAEIEGSVKNAATIAVERKYGHLDTDIGEEEMEEYRRSAIITPADLHKGIDQMMYGTQIKSRIRTDKERWATTIHELGHAAIPTEENGDPVNRITIVMTSKSLGLMDSSPAEGERYDWTREQFILRLKTMLAGRAAEKILLDKISTGASNDFERASALARQMVGIYGMSAEFGVKSIPLDAAGFPKSQVGETLLVKFNNAWSELIDRLEKEVDEKIQGCRYKIEAVAPVLFEEETLTGDEFRDLWDAAGNQAERQAASPDAKGD